MLTQESMKNMTINELADLYMEYREDLDMLKASTSAAQERFDLVRKIAIPEKMEELGFDNIKIKGVGRLSLRTEAYASTVKGRKEEAMEWLDENGHGDLIKPTVNASTLKAFLKEQVAEGVEVPDDIFNFTPYLMATITKT